MFSDYMFIHNCNSFKENLIKLLIIGNIWFTLWVAKVNLLIDVHKNYQS